MWRDRMNQHRHTTLIKSKTPVVKNMFLVLTANIAYNCKHNRRFNIFSFSERRLIAIVAQVKLTSHTAKKRRIRLYRLDVAEIPTLHIAVVRH